MKPITRIEPTIAQRIENVRRRYTAACPVCGYVRTSLEVESGEPVRCYGCLPEPDMSGQSDEGRLLEYREDLRRDGNFEALEASYGRSIS